MRWVMILTDVNIENYIMKCGIICKFRRTQDTNIFQMTSVQYTQPRMAKSSIESASEAGS